MKPANGWTLEVPSMLAPAGSGVQSCHCAIYGNLRTQSEGQMFDLNEGDRAQGAPPRATTRASARARWPS
eukprot:COSAG02_NODE_321_length_24780_cov_11.623962_19_plen_70_part_00